MLGASTMTNVGKFSGLTSLIGQNKRHVFEDIKTHIWKKIQEWKGKLLLQAGREVLVNVVALAIP